MRPENRVFRLCPSNMGIARIRLSVVAALCILIVVGSVMPLQADESASEERLVVRTFRVKHANVRQLEPILKQILSPRGSLSVDKRTNSIIVRDTKGSLNVIEEILRTLDAAMPSHTFRLDNADAEDTAKTIKRVLGPAGNIVEADPRTHSLYISTTRSELKRLKPLIAGLDRPSRQVLIEADILDVGSGKLKELGLEWEMRLGYDENHEAVTNIGAARATPGEPATGAIKFGTPSVTIPAVFDVFGNLITPEQVIVGSDFSASIQALVEDSSTRVLSRPRIMVVDGHEARFEVSTQEPYANTIYDDSGSTTSLDIQFLDIGIILETIPHISDDGYVLLEVRPEVSTLVREEFFNTTIIPNEGGAITNTIRVPVKSQNRAATTVMVRDGQTIAIGGLRTSDDTEIVRKVPILGDIPILGIPFRNLSQSKDARELVIFITPHIISPDVSSPQAKLLRQGEDGEGRESEAAR